MKITIYTITDCQFSKQEKEYLTSHKLPFEEKNLEINREFLSEMLTVSNNFAGTPVTRIEKDDGQITVLKGFTKEEFDKTLGIADAKPIESTIAPQATVPAPQPNIPQTPVTPSAPAAPIPTVPPTQPEQPIPPQAPVTPPVASPQSDALKSVLDNLQQKATPPTSTS